MKYLNQQVIIRTQRVSGLLFLLFLGLHLANTATAVLGPAAYDGFQAVARRLYQHPVYESLLILVPFVVHAACGIWRIRTNGIGRTAGRKLHRYTGIFLMIVVIGHVLATRGPSLIAGIFPDFAGIAFTFELAPAYFYPYYTLFAAAAIFHASFGIVSMWRRDWSRQPALAISGRILPILIGMAVFVSLLAFGGVLFDIDGAAQSSYAQMIRELLQ